jgi:hypothetical protein
MPNSAHVIAQTRLQLSCETRQRTGLSVSVGEPPVRINYSALRSNRGPYQVVLSSAAVISEPFIYKTPSSGRSMVPISKVSSQYSGETYMLATLFLKV